MSIHIATASAPDLSDRTPKYTPGPRNTETDASLENLNIMISDRLQRLSSDVGMPPGQVDLSQAKQERIPENYGASQLRYSGSDGPQFSPKDQPTYGNTDRLGRSPRNVDEAVSAIRRLGQDAVLAQANQLPPEALR